MRHLGPITVTLQELAGIIRTAIAGGPVSYESLTSDMDRMNTSGRVRRRALAGPGR